jgi:diaminohydroxyphosphoribosylaminopyrimidine deaminase/5-amino-6-(5-phosphoribosylamino)uracil reductase
VGAVVANAKTGEIYASAVTAPGGRPHAEALALALAGHRAKGAVLVTTLEPCCHHGLTPPCTDAIAKAGIAGVIYGSLDPDTRVAGTGVSQLRSKGIWTEPGPFEPQSWWLNIGHTLRMTEKRPFVQLKLAVDAEGLVAGGEKGRPVWVTGEEARARAHLLRAKADAILVGRTTMEKDNPQLTCRLPGLGFQSPVRVVLTATAKLPEDAALFTGDGPAVWVIASFAAASADIAFLRGKGVKILQTEADGLGRIPMAKALSLLAQEGVTRLLVEGGPTIASAFLNSGTVDEVILFRGKHRLALADERLLPFVTSGVEAVTGAPSFQLISESHAGGDTEHIYRAVRHRHGFGM